MFVSTSCDKHLWNKVLCESLKILTINFQKLFRKWFPDPTQFFRNDWKALVCVNHAASADILTDTFFSAMQTYEIRQLVQWITVIVLIPRQIHLVGILPGLAITVQLRHFHQVVNHVLMGFQHSRPWWEIMGGALSGVALVQRAGGGKQQERHWASPWNLTFHFGHLLIIWSCPRWLTVMLFYRNLLLSKCEVFSTSS